MRFDRSRFLGAAVAAALLPLALAADAAQPQQAASRKVNVNQASATQLAYLPRIGAKAAARIVEYRKTHGPFSRPEELMEVKGIGEKLFLSLKPYIVLSGPTTLSDKIRLASRSRQNAAAPAAGNPKPNPSRSAPATSRKPAPASVSVGKGR